jgi:hypothetical protein
MNTFDISKRCMFFILVVAALFSFAPSAPAKEINDLVFIHHSVGQNWLDSGLHDALLAKAYVDERNDITYGTVMASDPGRPPSLGEVPGDNTNICHWILWFNDYLAQVRQFDCADGTNRIILFKSCFPTSDIWDDGTEPGDPFSEDQTLANYRAVVRHPGGAGKKYLRDGIQYLPLEDIFAKHPEILFIPITSPPIVYRDTDDANAHRARVFDNWLKNEWLPSYHKTHPALNNVAVFDLFNVLANPDNALSGPNRLKAAYGGLGDDSHPNDAANAALTAAFAANPGNFIDAAWTAYSAATGINAGEPVRSVPVFGLGPNYPNPFNLETVIPFRLPEAARVRLAVFDLNGGEVAVLENGMRAAGLHRSRWNGRCKNQSPVPSAMYITVLETPFGRETGRILLLK